VTGTAKVNRVLTSSLTIGFGALILILWHLAYERGWVSNLVLPSIGQVLSTFYDGVILGAWWEHIGVTLLEALLGFVYGVAAAIALGAVFAFSETLRVSFYPYVLVAQTFPKIAIAPLLVTWLGYNMAPKVVTAALLVFFPVFVNTIAGLRSASEDHLNLLRAMQASKWQEFRSLRLPLALAYIFPALTVAIVYALLGSIVGEFVGAKAGLGYIIIQFTFLGDIAGVFAVLMVLAMIGTALYAILAWFEKKTHFKRD